MGIDSIIFNDGDNSLNMPLREVESEKDIKKYSLDITDEEYAKQLCQEYKIRYIPEDTECLLILIRTLATLCIDNGLILKKE